jgi:hypothetical protein
MSVQQVRRYWGEDGLPSVEEGNLTPLGFAALVADLYAKVRPGEVAVTLHEATQATAQAPHIAVECVRRAPFKGSLPRLQSNTPQHRVTVGYYNHIFRFRVVGRTIAQAEEEAVFLEHTLREYRTWLRSRGVIELRFSEGLGAGLDGTTREELPYTVRDYTVILREAQVDRQVPIELVDLADHGAARLCLEHVRLDDPEVIARGGALAHPVLSVVRVYRGPVVYAWGVDYRETADGIAWSSPTAPSNYSVLYYAGDARSLAITHPPATDVSGATDVAGATVGEE